MFVNTLAGSTINIPFSVVDPGGNPLNNYSIAVQSEDVNLTITTDANRDGQITFDGNDATTPITPWHFWINDSLEMGDITVGADSEIPGQTYASANFSELSVNGKCDLVNYFPVALGLSNALRLAPLTNGYEYHLLQNDGVDFNAFKFVYTGLTADNAFDYLTNASSTGYGTNFNKTADNADTVEILSVPGTVLDTNWLSQVQSNGGTGIILVEGGTTATQPLWLEIRKSGKLIGGSPLYLSLSGVEQMFYHNNLSYITGTNQVASRSTAPNAPASKGKNLLFVHGYNVNQQQARGTESEMYKRFFWSGSKAAFWGITWNGSVTQGDYIPNVTCNYHTNVVLALETAPALANFINSNLVGPATVVAHSLGNMIVLSAISDYGAAPSNYFMVDAAVAMEAVDGSLTEPAMIYSDWQPYDNFLYASSWWQLFPTNDTRSTLTWSNRLGNLGNVDVFNFYSSGEEVLRNDTNDPPVDVLSSVVTDLINYEWYNLPFGTYAWIWQEKGKGAGLNDAFIASSHGGWAFNSQDYSGDDPINGTLMSTNAADTLSNAVLATNAFFDFTSQFSRTIYDSSLPSFYGDLALYGSDATNYASSNRDRILSDAIPALTWAIGANNMDVFGDNNFDMKTRFEAGWPAARLTTLEHSSNWYHSDFSVVAYPFTHKLFDEIVNDSGVNK